MNDEQVYWFIKCQRANNRMLIFINDLLIDHFQSLPRKYSRTYFKFKSLNFCVSAFSVFLHPARLANYQLVPANWAQQ